MTESEFIKYLKDNSSEEREGKIQIVPTGETNVVEQLYKVFIWKDQPEEEAQPAKKKTAKKAPKDKE
jgi:hypothetical protein